MRSRPRPGLCEYQLVFPTSVSNSQPASVQKIMSLATNVSRAPLYDEADLGDWLHDDGPLVLIGDAAHPMPVRFRSPLFQFGSYIYRHVPRLAWLDPRYLHGDRRFGCPR